MDTLSDHMLARLIVPILRAFLGLLDKVFMLTREKSIPLYPCDENTNTINLPLEIEKELLHLVSTRNKIEAVRKVTRLTGAGLRVSKDYVDNLAKIRIKHR